jgi:hypothetical protein
MTDNIHQSREHYLSSTVIQIKEVTKKVAPVVLSTTLEISYIAMAVLILDKATTAIFPAGSRLGGMNIRFVTVIAPLAEEVIFRGIIQRGIGIGQWGWNRFVLKRELTEEELAIQRIWRVQVTAFVFGAAHLTNPKPSALQFVWCYVGGVTDGYLSEKYRTLSLSILSHGLNNILATSIMFYPKNINIILIVIIANPIFCYLLGTRNTASTTTLDIPQSDINSRNIQPLPVC